MKVSKTCGGMIEEVNQLLTRDEALVITLDIRSCSSNDTFLLGLTAQWIDQIFDSKFLLHYIHKHWE